MKRVFVLFLFSLFIMPFTFAEELKTKFFVLQLDEGVSLQSVYTELLRVPDSVEISSVQSKYDIRSKLSQRLDNLFYVVSDIMDIHLDKINVSLVLLKTEQEVADKVKQLTGKSVSVSSFYNSETNTIFFAEEDFRSGILGHELGHAIIAHYFVVPPPEKMQEVLCGYVEYSLQKDSQ